VARQYQEVMDSYLGPGSVSTDHIRALHRKGYLPLRFCAVPEGTRVPLRVPTFTIENTEPEFFWLVNYIESALSAQVWHPSTTATIALQYRRLLEEAALRTTGSIAGVDFQAHDFSFRGQTSIGAAVASGAGHLTSFLGTDSIPALEWIRRYYPGENGMVGASVPATEHSVMCAGGQDTEAETFTRLLETYPTGVLSVVSDTWDLWAVLTEILPAMKERIMARDGKLVIRPDSGNPVDIICGTLSAEELAARRARGEAVSPAEAGVVELLWEEFGGTVTAQGYRELDSHVGSIYGDSITLERAAAIIERLGARGFASTNVVFGIGSFTYQYVTRDTFASAIKATWAEVGGVGRDLMKDPVTDSGTKRSATGRLAVVRGEDGELTLLERATAEQEAASVLQVVGEDGRAVRTQSFAEVREQLREDRARS
jgi:nicotinamide phosphoribosyltransferase